MHGSHSTAELNYYYTYILFDRVDFFYEFFVALVKKKNIYNKYAYNKIYTYNTFYMHTYSVNFILYLYMCFVFCIYDVLFIFYFYIETFLICL